MSILESLLQVEKKARAEASAIKDASELEGLKQKYLGRKGELAGLMARLGKADPVERPQIGREANRVKVGLEKLFDEKSGALLARADIGQAATGRDLTMPGTSQAIGGLHPITRVIDEICDCFMRLGFSVVSGPEIETEHYNFEALNIPLDHPSRDSFDTFYLENGKLLRSQTSTVQIRVMENGKPPFKVIAPGRVYRPDATDATHSFMFHQIEGLMVDEGVSFADLKGVLMAFAKEFFASKVRLRFRPSFFPFTEPSAEVDVYSEDKGWLEILGAGMVHPHVLSSVNVSPERYTGFAFGMGVERIAMLRWGIKDIRMFYENDIRFLRQFA